MTKRGLNEKYFEWLCDLVYDPRYSKRVSYKKLLKYLNSVEFIYYIGLDGNRFEDGIDLRYRFGYEHNLAGFDIAKNLDDKPCSVLEMLIALSLRCEEHIMADPDIGDRTGQWFWNMIVNLGLGSMTDSKFDEGYVSKVIQRFLSRKYEKDGTGGLVRIPNCRYDLRNVEIWYQMMWYLDEVLKH